MDNRIRQIEVRDGPLIPAQAEVWIRVEAEWQTLATELRGRLMGPRCPFASTVEVAYPLRTPPSNRGPEDSALSRRVVIPEACLWEPVSPFLYQGPIELWQDGRKCDQVTISHGLRSFQLRERGLFVNGQPLTLRGRRLADCSEDEALRFRQAGFNLFVAPIEEKTLPLWERADRLGFLMLGQVADESEPTRRRLETLSQHASCLGWVIEQSQSSLLDALPADGLKGLICTQPPDEEIRTRSHFLIGPPKLANLGKPLLVQGEGEAEAPAAILGSVE